MAVYCQVQHLDREAKQIDFAPLYFGNNGYIKLRRDGLAVIISGNRHELARQFEQLADFLRGEQR